MAGHFGVPREFAWDLFFNFLIFFFLENNTPQNSVQNHAKNTYLLKSRRKSERKKPKRFSSIFNRLISGSCKPFRLKCFQRFSCWFQFWIEWRTLHSQTTHSNRVKGAMWWHVHRQTGGKTSIEESITYTDSSVHRNYRRGNQYWNRIVATMEYIDRSHTSIERSNNLLVKCETINLHEGRQNFGAIHIAISGCPAIRQMIIEFFKSKRIILNN